MNNSPSDRSSPHCTTPPPPPVVNKMKDRSLFSVENEEFYLPSDLNRTRSSETDSTASTEASGSPSIKVNNRPIAMLLDLPSNEPGSPARIRASPYAFSKRLLEVESLDHSDSQSEEEPEFFG